LSLLFVVVISVFTGFVVYKSVIQGGAKNIISNERYARSILLGQSQQVHEELKKIEHLVLRSDLGVETKHFLGDLHGFVKLQLKGSNFEILNSKFNTTLISTSNIEIKIKELLSNIREVKQTQFFLFIDSDKKQHIAIFYPQHMNYYLVLGSTGIFQSFVDLQKDIIPELIVINQRGEVLAHTQFEYIGKRAVEHPLFQSIKKVKNQGRSLEYQGRDGERWGTFEPVSDTNLFVLASFPKEIMKGNTQSLLYQLIVMAFGLLFLSLGMIILATGSSEKEYLKVQKHLQMLQGKLRQIENEKNENQKINLTPQEKDNEKFDAYGRITSALAFEIRSPLTSILAYSQSLLNHVKDSETLNWAENILKEARLVRAVLDKMFVFAGISENQRTNTKIEGVILKVLKELDTLFKEKGVIVKKEFKSTLSFSMNMEAMERVFKNLLLNSVEAMERMPKKEISILVEDQGQFVNVVLQDTGEGIDTEKKDQVFEPFFTTRAHQKHLGLGLTIVGALLKEQNAEIEIQSERSKGARIEIKFKTQEMESVMNLSNTMNSSTINSNTINSNPTSSESVKEKPNEPMTLSIKPVEGLMNMDIEKLFELSGSDADIEADAEAQSDAESDAESEGLGMSDSEDNDKLVLSDYDDKIEEKTEVIPHNADIEMLTEPPKVQSKEQFEGRSFSGPSMEMKKSNSSLNTIPFSVEIRKPGKG